MPNKVGERQCGIAECGTLHRNGYVIEFVDGRCSHVGRHCGRKHFGASVWKIQLRALKRKEEAAAAAEALLQAKDDAISTIETVRSAPMGWIRGRVEMTPLFGQYDCMRCHFHAVEMIESSVS